MVLLVSLAAGLLFASPASAATWTQPGYLYRYFVWGAQRLISSRSDDYRRYGYHTIERAPTAFQFAPGKRDLVPGTVEYEDGEGVKSVALSELLRPTGTHAFIVVRDNQVLYENYFNGFARDSLSTSWSLSKSVTSALVGIAISEGYIKSLDDPVTNYLPELKDQGFDAITIRNLLTMGSGIQYRIGFFPWDEFVLAGYYPNLRHLLLSDLKIMEPPGQSFHYNNFNTELIGMILERTTGRAPSQYLQEKIWKPIGMEYPATWSIDSEQDGFEITPTLLNARAIDLAKFGRLYLNNGNWEGRQIVPEHWVVESTTRDPKDRRPWDFLPMAGQGRLLQILLVGRFARRGRLQFHGYRHLWSVHFRLPKDESCDRADGRRGRNRPTLLARSLSVYRRLNQRDRRSARDKGVSE